MQTEQPTWGMRINRRGYGNQAIPEICLEWATGVDKAAWHEKGVVIWSHQVQRVECLSAAHALQYLEQMRANDNRQKKGRHKPGEEKFSVEETSSNNETRIEERFRLSPDQSVEFFNALEMNQVVLRKMADEDEQEQSEVLRRVYSFILKYGREHEADKFDLSTRSFQWEKDPVTNNWVCDRPPNRGSIFFTDDHLFWQGCIERPGRFKLPSRAYVKLEDAVTWAEQQLEAAEKEAIEPKEDEAQKISLDELIAQKRKALAEYWIDPVTLEPKRITYQAIILLKCAPYDYQTMEMSFGEKLRYDEKYSSPAQLANELQLDPQLDIKHFVSGLVMMTSRVTYFQRDIAISQAQRFWDQSAIVQQHRAGKITRAEYGIEEVETGYDIIIGACEDSENPFPLPQSREEHLRSVALEETLLYALDVNGYRAYLGFQPSRVTDETLLEMMHSRRARSSHIPIEAQLESERWLRMNNVK